MIRGRFAPTPSGFMHIGNLSTALLAWLQVRKAGGRFVLRMEDIDKPRSKPELARQIIEDLRWLGLDWDEGPGEGGPYAPYLQSLREAYYEEAFRKLQYSGWLYPCYCSRADLAALATAPHGLHAEGPVYPGTCRALTDEQRRSHEALKRPSYRFALPDKPFVFKDGIAGTQRFPAGAGGDFVVKRADAVIGYQLAVVVDDAAMHITDVVRGSDLLDSTPRQLALYDALGLPAPRFAHVPLLLGPDGRRLSKRDASLTAAAIRQHGLAAETVVGMIAHVIGWIEKPEPLRPSELVDKFKLETVPNRPLQLTANHYDLLTGR
ncbi:tRNA glutamyl-Q(34) synthetase GluQRS [Paenibacillus thermotolerans]|uniref:tRNA glutamyl-Q(34) synthetase GluQRS n=1 Tax=Paenibacillus thermotolerans TaxID=3027807 RepID=UPI0023674CC3|nr:MULTISPECIES: tRNA glutamyl-Q(34) synthetase GluQRS [unclassified Paenibacillus]